MRTLLVALAHPDDEVGCIGTIAAHRARGDRVVLLWLSRGEMTSALGPLPRAEVAAVREAHGREVARILECEARFLDFDDTRIEATSAAAHRFATIVAELRPDAIVTWGDAWIRGMRHPDHQATGKIVRDAATFARIAGVVAPLEPHRAAAPVFTLRGEHSTLPAAVVDVSERLDVIREVALFYRERVGWPEEEWLLARLRRAGEPWGLQAAELFDAWETRAGVGTTLDLELGWTN